MAGITPIGISIALAVLAIGMLALVAIRWRSKPKQQAEKWEKAEIMKQLLALSESENDLAVRPPSPRLRASAAKRCVRTGNPSLKTSQRTKLPIRSKTN
jgi:hypothetical protein